MTAPDEKPAADRGADRHPADETPSDADRIAEKARRKRRAEGRRDRSALYGLGMFGLVGWSVAIPTLAGTALGLWLDAELADDRSWTLAMLLAGISLGCLNAWFWVRRESRDD